MIAYAARIPATRQDYWLPKIERTRQRDQTHLLASTGAGWDVLTLWECELNDQQALTDRLNAFLTETQG